MLSPKNTPITVLFGGRNRQGLLLALAAAGYRVRRVFCPANPGARLNPSIAALLAGGLSVAYVTRKQLAPELTQAGGGILLSVGFPFLVPAEILGRFELCLNVHPTLLPHYKGPCSGAYILINGEPYTGSTVHVMDAGMDTGPIVHQKQIGVSRFDTTRSLQRRVYEMEPELLLEALLKLEDPEFAPVPQPVDASKDYLRPRTPADSEIDPSLPLARLYDAIRACDPDDYPAFFRVEGQKVCIRLWRPDKSVRDDTI